MRTYNWDVDSEENENFSTEFVKFERESFSELTGDMHITNLKNQEIFVTYLRGKYEKEGVYLNREGDSAYMVLHMDSFRYEVRIDGTLVETIRLQRD